MATKKEIVDHVNAAFSQNKPEGFLVHCSDDVVFTMAGDQTIKGKDALRKWMASMGSEPPVLKINHVISEGDFAVAHGEMSMKERDGATGSYAFCDVYRFRGDKIVELNAFVVKAKAQPAGV
jgi:ketosteroid isomerase-like protein